MKAVLIISAVFPPEPIVSSKLSYDIAVEMSKKYQVIVLHPRPTRPFGFLFNHVLKSEKRYIDITTSSYVCPKSNLLGRIYESYSFGEHCEKYIKKYSNVLSCIYVNAWPLFSQALIVKVAKQLNIPCLVHVQDIYPESFTNKIGIRFLSSFCKWILTPIDRFVIGNATHILAISPNMKKHLIDSRKVSEHKITVVENWQSEDEFIIYENKAESREVMSGLSFMYLGNIGPVAGVEFLINAFVNAKLSDAKLIIAGSGSNKKKCMDLAKEFKNVVIEFWDVPDGKVPEVQSKADIMLLPVKRGAAMSSIPSKLPAYMFSKKPIIASLDLESDTAKAVQEANCGIVVEPEKEDALIDAFQEVIRNWDSEVLRQKGNNGFNYAMERFSKNHNLSLVTKLIEKYVC